MSILVKLKVYALTFFVPFNSDKLYITLSQILDTVLLAIVGALNVDENLKI